MTGRIYREYYGFIGAMFGAGVGSSWSTGWPIEIALGTGVVMLAVAMVLVTIWEGGRRIRGGLGA